MGFEYSDITLRIRESHNQKGLMGRKAIPLIDCKKKKTYRKRRVALRGDILKKFEIFFGEQFKAVYFQISNANPKEAIYLTIEYIYRILELAPPKDSNKAEEHRFVYTFFWDKAVKEEARSLYNVLLWREGVNIWKENGCNGELEYKERNKPLNAREIKRVCENFPSIKPEIELNKITYKEYRNHIFMRMQNCFKHLFSTIWIVCAETGQYIQAFTEKVSQIISHRIKEKKKQGVREDRKKTLAKIEEIKIDLCDARIYFYIVQYLKDIAQKAINTKKFDIEIQDYQWGEEWRETLRYAEYKRMIVKCDIPKKPLDLPTFHTKDMLIETKQKRYLGNNREFEKELKVYLKEIKQEYLAHHSK